MSDAPGVEPGVVPSINPITAIIMMWFLVYLLRTRDQISFCVSLGINFSILKDGGLFLKHYMLLIVYVLVFW